MYVNTSIIALATDFTTLPADEVSRNTSNKILKSTFLYIQIFENKTEFENFYFAQLFYGGG